MSEDLSRHETIGRSGMFSPWLLMNARDDEDHPHPGEKIRLAQLDLAADRSVCARDRDGMPEERVGAVENKVTQVLDERHPCLRERPTATDT